MVRIAWMRASLSSEEVMVSERGSVAARRSNRRRTPAGARPNPADRSNQEIETATLRIKASLPPSLRKVRTELPVLVLTYAWPENISERSLVFVGRSMITITRQNWANIRARSTCRALACPRPTLPGIGVRIEDGGGGERRWGYAQTGQGCSYTGICTVH